MKQFFWPDIEYYFAAGNIDGVEVDADFNFVKIAVVYMSGDKYCKITAVCETCCYLDFRRDTNHTSGSGTILEAYVHDSSPLIEALLHHKLQGKTGYLCLEESKSGEVKHLEIVGELSLNVLCINIVFESDALPNTDVCPAS